MSDTKNNGEYIKKESWWLTKKNALKQRNEETCLRGKTEIQRKSDKLKIVGLVVFTSIISILTIFVFGGPFPAPFSKENKKKERK